MGIYSFFPRFLLHLFVFPQTQSFCEHSSLVLCDGQCAGFACAGFACADFGFAACDCDGLEDTFLVFFGEARPAKAAFRMETSRFSAFTLSMACFNSA